MNRSLSDTANKYIQAHERRKWWQRAIVVMASVVIFCTTYALIMPAVTQQGQTYCGIEEHKEHTEECFEPVKALCCDLSEEGHSHSAACYKEREILTCSKPETNGHIHDDNCFEIKNILICDNTEDDHVHGSSCYKEDKTLICGETESEPHQHDETCFETERICVCGLTEQEPHQHSADCYSEDVNPEEPTCGLEIHEHTLQCFSNPDADVETSDVWERSFDKAELTGNLPEDVVAIAKTQLGYEESTRNYHVLDDGVTVKGYTRYGAWAGVPYDDWDAVFCAFCLCYANVDTDMFPMAYSCRDWAFKLADDYGLFHLAGTYEPKIGDLVFFHMNDAEDTESEVNHMGIIAEISHDNDTGLVTAIKVIEGDSENKVRSLNYDIEEDCIIGFGEVPETSSANADPLPMFITPLGTPNLLNLNAATYISTYDSAQNMPAGATSTNVDNYWQIVSGYYGAIKNGDGTYTYDAANNNAVRIQKAVIPTGEENQFQIYLNVEPQMSWQEFLESLDNYQTHNNSSSFNPSSGCSQLLTPDQYEALPDRPGSDGEYKGLYTPFTVDYVDNSVRPAKHYTVIRYGNFTGNGKNAIQNVKNGSYCFSSEKFSYNGLQNSINWPALISNPNNGLTVDISNLKRNFTFAEEPVYPKTVTDPMGDLIIYEGMISYDGGSYNAPDDNNQQVLTWTLPTVNYPDWPYYSTYTDEGALPGYPNYHTDVTYVDNVVPVMINGKQTLYYTDVLEMRYAVSLDTADPEFVSAAPLANSPSNSIYPTNKTTTLGYEIGDSVTKLVDFAVPSVRGLRWDVVVRKVDSNTPNVTLPGASFSLYEAAAATDADVVLIPGTTDLYGIAKSIITTGTNGESQKAGVVTGKTYYLVEDIPPHGYEKEAKPIAFIVTESNGTKSIQLVNGDAFASNCVIGTTEGTTFTLIVSDTEKEHITPTPPPDPQYPTWKRDVTISKQIDYLKDNADGQNYPEDLYRLYLSLESETKPIDLLLVIDQSYSMHSKLTQGDARTRQQVLLDFLNGDNGDGFIADFLDANEENDLAILTFSSDCSYSAERYVRHWGERGTTLSLPAPNGATNYTAALDIADRILAESPNNDHLKMMIFLSDGVPTLAYADGRLQSSYANNNLIGTGTDSSGGSFSGNLDWYLFAREMAIFEPDNPEFDPVQWFDGGTGRDDQGTVVSQPWIAAEYPYGSLFTSAVIHGIPGLSEFPFGEITDEDAFCNFAEQYFEWDENQRSAWIDEHVTYFGDTFNLFWSTKQSFYEFSAKNPDVLVYSIGYSGDLQGAYASGATRSEVLEYFAGKGRYYPCTSADQLNDALKSITALSSVKIEDTLSTYAELAAEPDLVITMKHGDEEVTLYEDGAYTAYGEEYLDTSTSPLNADGTLSVIFNPNAMFDKAFECIASFNICPTNNAYNEFTANGYNTTGDLNTDYQDNETSSGKEGFFSNDTASASWKTGGGNETEDFDKPVIQVHTVKLTITKQVSGSTTDEVFPFEVSATNGLIIPPTAGSGYTLDDSGVAHFELADGEDVEVLLQPGATVLIRETEHDGFTQKITKGDVPVSNADTYEFVISADTGLIVTNIAGYELPNTGGIGTTIFYIVGGVLAIGALVLLIAKKRMNKED